MVAMSTSPNTRGSIAASCSVIFRFFLFSAMSFTVPLMPTPSFSLIRPAFSSRAKARPPLEGSLGMATLAPSFSSSSFLILEEYTPKGSM
ncbi:hypothetical protein D3C75_1095190 [compost metagenome]